VTARADSPGGGRRVIGITDPDNTDPDNTHPDNTDPDNTEA